MPELNPLSRKRLNTCDKRLQDMVRAVAPELPFNLLVVCGHRGEAEQNAAYERGASTLRFPQSRHNKLPSLAVDLAPLSDDGGSILWSDLDRFDRIAAAMKAKARELKIPLTWGGDWKRFVDRPHFQMEATG